jgi:hypothetical protein
MPNAPYAKKKNIFGLKANNFVFLIFFLKLVFFIYLSFFLLNYLGIICRAMDLANSLGLA